MSKLLIFIALLALVALAACLGPGADGRCIANSHLHSQGGRRRQINNPSQRQPRDRPANQPRQLLYVPTETPTTAPPPTAAAAPVPTTISIPEPTATATPAPTPAAILVPTPTQMPTPTPAPCGDSHTHGQAYPRASGDSHTHGQAYPHSHRSAEAYLELQLLRRRSRPRRL